MSTLRFDATTRDWVVFAPERAQRPHEMKKEKRVERQFTVSSCPFCPGNEHLTPEELFAFRDGSKANNSNWHVRVVPNKFAALSPEALPEREEEGPGLYHLGGYGRHEVLIESPDHFTFLGDQPIDQIEFILRALQVRFHELMKEKHVQTVVIFKNHGTGAGTSLRHPHWQLIAIPVVPRSLRQRQDVAIHYFDLMGRCLYCDLVAQELQDGRRVLAENDHFAAILPYASHVPYEIWLMPKAHQPSFAQVCGAHFRPLAELLKKVLQKLFSLLGEPDFNLTITTVPKGDEDKPYFLWHAQILPRLTTPAGFELGTGMSINSMLPEEAARLLREVSL